MAAPFVCCLAESFATIGGRLKSFRSTMLRKNLQY